MSIGIPLPVVSSTRMCTDQLTLVPFNTNAAKTDMLTFFTEKPS